MKIDAVECSDEGVVYEGHVRSNIHHRVRELKGLAKCEDV